MPLALIKKPRLLGLYLLRFFYGIFPPWLAAFSGYISLRIGNVRFIGTRVHVEWCADVLETLQHNKPELYSTLVKNKPFVFCCLPAGFAKNTTCPPFFFMGNKLLTWEKTGLLAHFVWLAFQVQAGLDDPSTSISDFHDGYPLLKHATRQPVQWRASHDQPEKLVRYYTAWADSLSRYKHW